MRKIWKFIWKLLETENILIIAFTINMLLILFGKAEISNNAIYATMVLMYMVFKEKRGK